MLTRPVFMHQHTVLLAILFLCLCATASADRGYPTDYFRPPVASELRLSGTFGELRANHFHTGIDIKGGMGVPIVAAAEGFIARVIAQGKGYGNVIYVEHPNGFTTVYAHLDAFAPELASYVRAEEFKQKSFTVDLTLPVDKFPVKQGQILGKMGTTGHSFGPHLHFEIRETATDTPLNPLLFGMPVLDKTPPRMHELRVYQLDERGNELGGKNVPLRLIGNRYRPNGVDTLLVQAGNVGMGIKVYDHMDGVTNWNGIFQLEMFVNDQRRYRFRTEAIPFDESRYINAHVDYSLQQASNSFFNRCFVLPGNALGAYDGLSNRGMISLKPGEIKEVRLVAADLAGNQAESRFLIKATNATPVSAANAQYQLFYDQENRIETHYLTLHFPLNSLYTDVPLRYRAETEASSGVFSRVHVIQDYRTPVHAPFEIAIRANLLPDPLREKAFVAYCGKGSRVYNCGGTWLNDKMVAQVNAFGNYSIMVDTLPPRIVAERFTRDMRRYSSMRFKIYDNFGTRGDVPGLQYQAYLDGEWILMTTDEKNDRLEYIFPSDLARGKHTLRLEVTDAMGNQKVLESEFLR